MLEGKTVNLRVLEKEDLALFAEWVNNPEFYGEYDYLDQKTRTEIEKKFENSPPENRKFVIQKKDGTRIGIIEVEQHSAYGGWKSASRLSQMKEGKVTVLKLSRL